MIVDNYSESELARHTLSSLFKEDAIGIDLEALGKSYEMFGGGISTLFENERK
jgi:hypothetical protein